MTASLSQQLLALYFAIIYIRQLSSSEKSLVWKKNSSIYLKDLTDLDFFFSFFSFVFFFRRLNTIIFTSFEKLNSISNIFQETHDTLVLTDPVIICIYLRTIDRHFRDQGNVRHATSKLLKCDFVQALNTFRNPSVRIMLPGRHLLLCVKSRLASSTNVIGFRNKLST